MLLLAGCSGVHRQSAAERGDTIVSGEGKITQLNAALGSATLQTKHGLKKIWWRTEVNEPGHGSWKPGEQAYPEEPQQVRVTFPAQEGDMIQYRGIESYGEILVTKVTVKEEAKPGQP